MIDLGNGPVECYYSEAMVCSIHNQVLAHDGQTNEAEVTTGSRPRWSADIDAGKTGARVSPSIYQYFSSKLKTTQWVKGSLARGFFRRNTRNPDGGVIRHSRTKKGKLTLLCPPS